MANSIHDGCMCWLASAGDHKLYDAKSAETMDLDGVDEKDLKAIVTKVAIELLASNEDFRDACLTEALRRNPQLLEELSDV